MLKKEKKKNPKITVFNMDKRLLSDENGVIEKIIKQNTIRTEQDQLKIKNLKTYETKQKKTNLIVELDAKTYNEIKQRGCLYIGWKKCYFSDYDFSAAANQIRAFSKRPSDSDMLDVYALYKQATVGDVNIDKPSGAAASAKWNAWSGKKGVSSDQAKEQYVAKIAALAPKFA